MLPLALGLAAALAQIAPLPTTPPNPNEGSPAPIQIIRHPAAPLVAGKSSVLIVQSPSTNAAGFTIVLEPTGAAAYTSATGVSHGHVEIGTARALFARLRSAGKLSALRAGSCMKSASFGTTTILNYHGVRSPDLSCPVNATERGLWAATQVIIEKLGVVAGPRKVRLL